MFDCLKEAIRSTERFKHLRHNLGFLLNLITKIINFQAHADIHLDDLLQLIVVLQFGGLFDAVVRQIFLFFIFNNFFISSFHPI